MAHAIGALGSPITLATKAKPTLTREQRDKLAFPLSTRLRNQKRRIVAVEIKREAEPPKYRLIREGHLHHYATALPFATVSYVKDEKGRPAVVAVLPRVKRIK